MDQFAKSGKQNADTNDYFCLTGSLQCKNPLQQSYWSKGDKLPSFALGQSLQILHCRDCHTMEKSSFKRLYWEILS